MLESAQTRPPELDGPAPRATYRLQFNERFRLPDALALVPYLHALGISHVYASPLLMACPHSTHGYDVCDFSRLNPELGTEEDLERLSAALKSRNMGLVLDIVPNHMGIGGPENRWWWQVLTRGQNSPFAECFDIDWQSPDPRLRGKVLVPALEAPYQRVLRTGGLQIEFDGVAFALRHGALRLPLAPNSVSGLLARAAKLSGSEALGSLAETLAGDPEAAPDQEVGKLCGADAAASAAISLTLRKVNSSPDALDALARQQHYRLTSWADADRELNYRRFFNISSLAGVRSEEPRVFQEVHRRVLAWRERGWVQGWRIDHVDGLRDPEAYLCRLRSAVANDWIVVEKILQAGERLPGSWPVAGTTGYDFLARASGLFVDPTGERRLADFYASFTGNASDYPTLVLEKKQQVLRELLRPEVDRLVALGLRLGARHWRARDFSAQDWRDALCQFIARLPVYRAYARPDAGSISPADAARLSEALGATRCQRPDLDPDLFEFLGEVLCLRLAGPVESEFVARLQQVTGPAMAKGVEDTAFYCFNRFVALNEVGGDPGRFGCSVEEFHRACAEAQAQSPHSLLATSTHDTKWSEDVRARLALLSEIPEQWCAQVRCWAAWNERHRLGDLPDRDIEYRFYQTLVGAWPLEIDRALLYLDKAACEAKTRTTWARRDAHYDKALRTFATGALNDPQFAGDLERFVAGLADPGYVNSLGQTLLKLTAPGVPDFYQGCELWDLSLADPDNRREVDFRLRKRALAELPSLSWAEVWKRRAQGWPKLWLIQRILRSRAERGDLLAGSAPYRPLSAQGPRSGHVVAFQRGENSITVIPRLVLGLRGDWGDTSLDLASGHWRNELSGEVLAAGSIALGALLREFPVAWLTRKEA